MSFLISLKRIISIARDKTGLLYAYFSNPKKYQVKGYWNGIGLPIHAFNIGLPMIKWEDEQAWKISDLKKLKVVKNYLTFQA